MTEQNSQVTDVAQTATVASKAAFTPIGSLLALSWERLKLCWKNLLPLIVLLYVLHSLWLLALGAVALRAIHFNGETQAGLITPATALAPLAGILLLVFAIVIAVATVICSAAVMLSVAEADQQPSFGSVLGRSSKLFVPLFLTLLLVAFLITGGLPLFVMPGIIIAIFLAFAGWEVVTAHAEYLRALKNSATIIQQNFGSLFVRFLVILGLCFALIIAGNLGDGIGQLFFHSLAALFHQVNRLLGYILLCYTTPYVYLIYKEARSRTNFEKPASTVWMWIVSIIGWILGLIMMLIVGAAIAALVRAGLMNKGGINTWQQMNTTGSGSSQMRIDQANPLVNDDGSPMNPEEVINTYGKNLTEEEKAELRGVLKDSASPQP